MKSCQGRKSYLRSRLHYPLDGSSNENASFTAHRDQFGHPSQNFQLWFTFVESKPIQQQILLCVLAMA
jgi:hypothetical protein